jgi:hypothetical protein
MASPKDWIVGITERHGPDASRRPAKAAQPSPDD